MLDNKGVVGSWKRLRRPAPSEWAKVADRDVHGYIALLRQELAGVWRVRHVKGHAERRKRRELWTLHEVGNDAVDKMAGRVSAAVVAEVRQWDKQVAEWERASRALEESGAWMREAPKPTRRRAAPAVKAC